MRRRKPRLSYDAADRLRTPPARPDRRRMLGRRCGRRAADLSAVAAALAIAPAVVGAYRDRRLGPGLALAGAALFGAIALTFGAPLPVAALGSAAVAGLGLLVAATIGTAAGEASAYRVWYHGLRDRLPTPTLFFMPATGRVHDLNDRAAALLGPLQARSLAEAFEDSDAYAAFATDIAAGEVVHRGVLLRGPGGGLPLVRALGRDGDPDPRGRLGRRPDGRAVGRGRARRERGRAPGARGPRPGCGPARRRRPPGLGGGRRRACAPRRLRSTGAGTGLSGLRFPSGSRRHSSRSPGSRPSVRPGRASSMRTAGGSSSRPRRCRGTRGRSPGLCSPRRM